MPSPVWSLSVSRFPPLMMLFNDRLLAPAPAHLAAVHLCHDVADGEQLSRDRLEKQKHRLMLALMLAEERPPHPPSNS